MWLEPSEEAQQGTTWKLFLLQYPLGGSWLHKHFYKRGEQMNSVSCTVQVKMAIDNETDYDKEDETMKLNKWILHLALIYF